MSRRNGTLSDRSGQVVLPLADAGWLAPLLDGGRVASILTDLARPGAPAIARCTLRHVRYRPGASCTVSYQVFPDGPGNNDPIAVYARTLAPGRGLPGAGGTPEPALRPTARLLDGPTPLPSLNTVLREFPLDATLPQLRHLADARRLGQLVSRGVGQHLGEIGELPVRFTTLRYKPEHRLVLRADWLGDDRPLATCQVRFEYGTDLPGRLSLVQQLARAVPTQGLLAAPGWEIHLPEPGCTVVEWQKGRDLARAVRKGDTDAASLTGQALAELGRIRIEGLPSRTPAAALDPLAQQVLVLQRHSPAGGLARRFAAVMRALEDLQFSPRPGLVHGDFHQGQLLASGQKVCLLDWDRAHRGDPACDFGRFLAQLQLLDLLGKSPAGPMAEAFRQAFAAAGGSLPTPSQERFWLVLALAELALREVRRLRPDWLARTAAILDRCDLLLTRGGRP